MQCFILAGGFATRLWPLTERRAKPLLPLAGKPLLSYIAEQIPQNLKVTVSTNAVFADDLKAWAKTMKPRSINLLIEDTGHEDQKLGALGAVARWIETEKIDDDVLLLAGDNYAAFSLEKFLGLARGNPLLAAHDIGDPELSKQFGTVITEGNDALKKVTSFEEKPAHPKSTFVSTGWWILPKHTLPVLQEYAKEHPDNVGGIFEEFLRRNIVVDCFVFPELWKDIGSFEAYMSLHRAIVGDKRLVHASAVVDAATTLSGSIDLGPKTTIEKSTLSDCILFGNSVIRDCVLERCIIDEGCKLEGIDLTDQMVRAGTVMKL